jgi:PleD family two-component response regulator
LTDVGAAVGVTLLRPGDTSASFVKRADNDMYLAKQTGKRVSVVWLRPTDAVMPAKWARAD